MNINFYKEKVQKLEEDLAIQLKRLESTQERMELQYEIQQRLDVKRDIIILYEAYQAILNTSASINQILKMLSEAK
jgi:hypothetical protein